MKIRVDAFTLTPSVLTVGTAGSYGIPKLECSFSKEWEGLQKKASFYAGDENYVVVLDENGEAVIPAEIMVQRGEYPFLISGTRGNRVMLSLAGKLVVLPTLTPAITPPTSPTPTEMAQIYDMLEEARTLSSSAVDCIDEARNAAADAGHSATYANSAAADARAATALAYTAINRLVSIQSASIDGNGHLQICLSDGTTVDAGISRGSAISDSYRGNGTTQRLQLGFRPALLFLTRLTDQCATGETAVVTGAGLQSGSTRLVTLEEDGFTVVQSGSNGWNSNGADYRYTVFADDPEVLSYALDRKLSKPESYGVGNLPIFSGNGQLRDSGFAPWRFANRIQADTTPAKQIVLTDAIEGRICDLSLYGPNAFVGTPSPSAPLQPQMGENPYLRVSANSYSSQVHQFGVTLRGIQVPSGSVENLTVNGTTMLCDQLTLSGSHKQVIGQKILTGSETWYASSTTGLYYTLISDARVAAVNPCSCGHFRSLSGYNAAAVANEDCFCFMHHAYTRCYFKYTAFTSLNAWKAFLTQQYTAGTPVTVLYVLASPVTTQLTVDNLKEFQTRDGRQTISSNCYFSLGYAVDTKSYIDRKIREVVGT